MYYISKNHEVSILSTNADIFTVISVSFFLTKALYITGSIVDNGGLSSGLLQTTGSELREGGRGEGVNNNLLPPSSHSSLYNL